MNVALGSDHRGYASKVRVKAILESGGHEVTDFGCEGPDSCDYPDAAFPAAQSVARGDFDRCILFCGTGIGMSITANKVKGIRASLCHDEITAEMARRHNDANVLCLPSDFISENTIDRVVEVWLSTPFDGGRHERRINKITTFENNNHPQI